MSSSARSVSELPVGGARGELELVWWADAARSSSSPSPSLVRTPSRRSADGRDVVQRFEPHGWNLASTHIGLRNDDGKIFELRVEGKNDATLGKPHGRKSARQWVLFDSRHHSVPAGGVGDTIRRVEVTVGGGTLTDVRVTWGRTPSSAEELVATGDGDETGDLDAALWESFARFGEDRVADVAAARVVLSPLKRLPASGVLAVSRPTSSSTSTLSLESVSRSSTTPATAGESRSGGGTWYRNLMRGARSSN